MLRSLGVIVDPKIFITYSSKDQKVAQTICKALENRGLACWILLRNVKPGQNFQEQIVKAIPAAKIMILVFTANANNSNEIKKELALASQNNLVVIPVRIEDVTPNEAFAYEFATRRWIDLFDDWENSIARLVELIAAATEDYPSGELEITAAKRSDTAGTLGGRPTPRKAGGDHTRQRSAWFRYALIGTSLAIILAGATAAGWKFHGTEPNRPVQQPAAVATAPEPFYPPLEKRYPPPNNIYPPPAKIDLNPSTADGMASLGYRYQSGLGIPVDYDLALKWFTKAADAGSARAENALGFRYHDGIGCPKDYDEARKWWEKAADQNNAAAQFGLGILYELGQVVPQDYTQARKWYEKSDANGNIGAPEAVGRLYEKGLGVPQDFAQARKWFEKADIRGNHFEAQKSLKEIEGK
jgi:hypothetical protein